MSTYSLLQVSLDQRIDRRALEEASTVAGSVARADCARMERDLFGILISGLPLAEASAFQAELRRWDFPTDVVADAALPQLHEPFTVQAVELIGEVLVFADAMGRKQTRPLTDLVFMAGGFVAQTGVEFRLDFFFWASPNRLRLAVNEMTMFFYQGRRIRLRDPAGIHAMIDELLGLLPPERLNQGLKNHNQPFLYPARTSYEEELRWHFFHLIPRA
jgi:hypothetical protein